MDLVLADSNILLRVAQPSHPNHEIALAAMDKLLQQDFDLLVCKQAHDAHLAAAMRVYGVQKILTFNGTDFKRYSGITVWHPADV